MKLLSTALVSSTSLLALSFTEPSFAQQIDDPFDEVIVTAELIDKSVLDLPNSVTVLTNKDIEDRNAQPVSYTHLTLPTIYSV